MSRLLCSFRPRLHSPTVLFGALVLLTAAFRPPAEAAVPAGVPLAWGHNSLGALGNGTFDNSSVPIAVPGLSGIVAIDGGANHCLALKADGTVFSWGDNPDGRLGLGLFSGPRNTPAQVLDLSGVIAVTTGRDTSMAIRADGTLWAWGLNESGQVGDGTLFNRSRPVQIAGLSGVVASRTGDHSLALKADGSVWAWGLNNYGQLGDGTFTNRSRPVRVAHLPPVVAIGIAGRHSLALEANGTVWAWGINSNRELGNGTLTSDPPGGIPTPGPVSNLSEVIAIADGNQALRADGTVWRWGGGRVVPAPVVHADGSLLDQVVAIAAGRAVRSPVTSDSSVWTWGGNQYGQLGDGTTTDRSTPVRVLGQNGEGFLTAPISLGGHGSHRVAVELAPEYSAAIQQPVNGDGSSIFKKGSTVQVKFRLTNQSAGITDAQARFGYAQINSLNPGNVNEPVSNAAGTPGILFQYDAASGEYRYHWRTTGVGMGSYRLRIDLGDGVARSVVVGLK